ncbi:MAG: sarcosine oxidase subunit gamma [Gammaproteobacteria bacterium]
MNATPRTPLADKSPIQGDTSLRELPLNGKINLRGEPDNQVFLNLVSESLGVDLPLEANTVSQQAEVSALWLGPNEWLVYLPLDAVDAAMVKLKAPFEDMRAAATDVSDYYTLLELSGPDARAVIATGSPFDTRPQSFTPGQCAQTLIGHASIIINAIDKQPTYQIQVRWSFAEYLFDYLARGIADCRAVASV